MNAIAPLSRCPAEETDAEQRQRMRAYTFELAEINMQAARVAGQRIAEQHLDGTADQTRPANDPSLALSRATRGVATAISTELSVTRAPQAPRRALASDTRRGPLRLALLPGADREPDRGVRLALQYDIGTEIEETLLADPKGERSLPDLFAEIAEKFGLVIDVTQLSDEIIGIPPRRNPDLYPPNSSQHDARQPGPEPPPR